MLNIESSWGQFELASPTPNSGGTFPLTPLRPCLSHINVLQRFIFLHLAKLHFTSLPSPK